jgi:hypothetical protein
VSAARFQRLAASLRAELQRVERTVDEARQSLSTFATREPNRLELRGLGDIVHDFYTGTERLFEKVATEIDGGVPSGSAWHRELLDVMALEVPGRRPPVVTQATAHALDELLRFRHLYRNLYGFELEWTRLQPLLAALGPTFDQLRRDAEAFVGFLEEATHDPS